MNHHRRGIRSMPGPALLAFFSLSCGALPGVLTAAPPTSDPPPASPSTAEAEIPHPDPPFRGVANRTLQGSKPDFPRPVAAPPGAPNVLLVLIDDAGFGNPSTFGGPCQTPTLSKLAAQGLRYNRFHVTALCSPTRAALLTGRNHHRVGFGSIAEYPGPFPGYTASRPRTCTPLPRILRENGYVTGGFGKWHLTPDNVQGPAGPFDHWPQSWGFDHYWGFLSGAAGQYDPIITQDNTTIGVQPGKDGKLYYFPDDLTDKSIEWLHAVRAQDAGGTLLGLSDPPAVAPGALRRAQQPVRPILAHVDQ